MKTFLSYKDYLSIFEKYGQTDVGYLYYHYPRFCLTQKTFYESWSLGKRYKLLDVGAHWLHQSLLYAQDGFEVTATDFPGTLSLTSVKKIAKAYNILLFPYNDLSDFLAFSQFPDNHFNIILFSEIIEHITFNPIDMWKGLYRILAPDGKIIITTPNFYYWKSRFWNFRRLIRRMGGGITVDNILNFNTYSPHWKEYSAREIKTYFQLLSSDFCVGRLVYLSIKTPSEKNDGMAGKLFGKIESNIRILRQNIYAEIDLVTKEEGIVITPHW